MNEHSKSGSGEPRQTNSRPVVIEVHAENTPTGVDFHHKWKFENEPGDPSKKGRIDLPFGDTSYKLRFKLRDETGKELKFIDPCEQAMYVAVGTRCPSECGDGGQIDYRYPWTPHQLTVEDLNAGDECTLAFTLRFDGERGQQASDPGRQCPPYEYDPIIKNGGGGGR